MRPAAKDRTYHHGGLRDALLAAAEELMSERSGWTFTLREVARAAGVSHNAPYNHFADRRALLSAVAARGFDELATALRLSLEGREDGDVADGLRATARAYVDFAAANPSRFRLMFGPELADCADTALAASGAPAFGILQDLTDRGVATGVLRPDPRRTHALTAWSLVHGLATLVLDRRLPLATGGPALDALTDAAATTLLTGLCA